MSYFCMTESTKRKSFFNDTSLSEFFSLVRKERKGQKEERIPLLISFCRLAATGANTLPRPSHYSLITATGSKRSSADSDLLLCHVRLWRASRLKFWQKFGCEHSEMGFVLIVPSAHILNPRPLALSRRRRPRSLARIGQFPTGEGWRKSLLSSAHRLRPRPPHIFQRACRQCVHESARLFRVICSHAW